MKIRINEAQCTGCGSCEETCPTGAMSLTLGVATIDYALCTGCQACIDACPTGAITAIADTVILHQPADISDISEARPLLTKPQPWLASVLAFAGREILPRLADALIGALERKLTRPTTTVVSPASTSPSGFTARGRSKRRQNRHRGGCIGSGHYKNR
jgi:NAD-dependent dihydropyrimidine dehydrogenase PreA subunit